MRAFLAIKSDELSLTPSTSITTKGFLSAEEMPFRKEATLLVAVYEHSSLAYAKISISLMEKNESNPM